MIRYALACERGHTFASWFQSSGAYERQVKLGLVVCPVCNSSKIAKTIMAPRIASTKKRRAGAPVLEAPAQTPPQTATPTEQNPAPVAMVSPQEREFRKKLRELRQHLVQNADYVGPRFPEEARKMHYGEVEHRSIYGEASPEQARELHEEGIEFHPLPVLPDERN